MRAMKGATRDFLRVVVAVVLGAQLALAFAISGSSAAAPLPPLSIAVIGDQNTAGMNNRVVWPTLMAERTGWAVSNYAQPEAGFAADDSGGKSLARNSRISFVRTLRSSISLGRAFIPP